MQSIKEMQGAGIVVDTCAALRPDDDVLIVADWNTAEVAERVAGAARERSDQVSLTFMEPREHNGNEPPESVAAAMREANVILHITWRSITHSAASVEARDESTRWVSLNKFTPEQLRTGGLYADFEAMRPYCDEMAQKFTDASEARITSPQGTNVTVDIEGREGNSHPGIADEGGMHTGLVHIEANTAPVEGGTNGTVVFDGAIPDLDIGALEEDVTMEIEDGTVVSVEGGKEAERIQSVWAEYDDPAVYNIAQLAVGMNPECREFNDWMSHAHARYGNVHFGIGTSSLLGGKTRAPVHFDAMMGEATLEFDGEVVLEDGDNFTFID